MVKRKVLFDYTGYDGGQKILPSAFPFYSKSEIDELYSLSEEDRIVKIAKDLNLEVDSGQSCVIMATETLWICDLTSGGENPVCYDYGVSPFVISAIISALSEIDFSNGNKVVLSTPSDDGIILSALLVKFMGFPIDKIIVSGVDVMGDNVESFDIADESIEEYICDFYEDFDILLGEEDAKGMLAGDIYTDGFETPIIALTAFGVAQSPELVCYALSGKKKDLNEAVKWIDLNCAYNCNLNENTRKPTRLNKKTMKELCNICNTAKVY